MARHNKLHDGVSDLDIKAFTHTHMHYDPKIYTGHTVNGKKDKLKGFPSKNEVEMKGYPIIKDLCIHWTESIHNMGVVNTEPTSYHSKKPRSVWKLLIRRRRRRRITSMSASNRIITSLT